MRQMVVQVPIPETNHVHVNHEEPQCVEIHKGVRKEIEKPLYIAEVEQVDQINEVIEEGQIYTQ